MSSSSDDDYERDSFSQKQLKQVIIIINNFLTNYIYIF